MWMLLSLEREAQGACLVTEDATGGRACTERLRLRLQSNWSIQQ